MTVYNTGDNKWEHFDDWPVACERGCSRAMKPLYVSEKSGLSFERPTGGGNIGDSYTSDPAKPVPFIPRPIVDPFSNMAGGSGGRVGRLSPWSISDSWTVVLTCSPMKLLCSPRLFA